MAAPPPGQLRVDGDFVFPKHGAAYWADQTPVTLPIKPASPGAGGGLMYLGPGPGWFTGYIRAWWSSHPDVWATTWQFTMHYASRDDTHIYGVQGYSIGGKIENNSFLYTGYYNPNAYWTPASVGDTPPAGADPGATPGQDPATLDPPHHSVWKNKPYHYADLKVYDQLGKNRTGDDLAPDPDHTGEFLDPYVAGTNTVTFLYDDQDPLNSNLAGIEWAPDGDQTQNQRVALASTNTEKTKAIRMIARNITSWTEIGVYSEWDSVPGQNVVDVSKDNIGAYAEGFVERLARPPNFATLTLHLEPEDEWPAFGAIGWRPQPFRDFNLGDRVKVRFRKGYLDSGLIVMRIMGIKVGQADASGNVTVELDCVPHNTDISEISVVD